MNLTFEEYMELIPEETKKFVKRTLEFLYYYETKTNGIKITGREMLRTAGLLKGTVSAFLGATQDLEIKAKLQNKGFDIDIVHYAKSDIEKLSATQQKEMFEKYNNLFLTFNDKSKYVTQSVFNVLRKAIALSSSSDFTYNMSTYLKINDSIKNYIRQTDNSVRKQNEIELEEELYSDIPVSTITYLETASKIREAIRSSFNNSNMSETEYIKNDDNYLVPISLFLSLFEIDSKEKEDIVAYFTSKGVTKETIKRVVRYPGTSDIRNYDSNLECIKLLYKQYYEKREKENNCLITITDILKRVLDRTETKNIGVEKILEKLGVTVDSLDNLEEEIEKYSLIRKEKEETEYAKNFYASLNADTKEFINFSTKIYQLLLEKMQDRKHNTNILSCEDDADTLALYIASSFYNTDIEKFYVGHGVTLEKVLKLLNLQITKEEIEKVKLNSKLTIDRFKRFVVSGVNSNRKSDNVKVNDVARNLCNREFNKSMIMENIFEEIRRDINLPNDFTKMVDEYFKNVEKERTTKLTREFFLNKSNNFYNYLALACSTYKTMTKHNNQDHSDKENIIMSLLYAYLQSNQQDSDVYEFLGITKAAINKHYGYNIDQNTKKEFDIDTIINVLSPYVEEKDSQIKLKIFDKVNKDLKFSLFLGKLNLTYDSFSNLEEVRRLIDIKNQEKYINEMKEKDLSKLTPNAKKIIKDAVKIYEAMLNDKKEIIDSLNENDLVVLALFLGIIKNNNSEECIKKYEITYSSILEILGYDTLELKDDYSYETFKTHFKKYCKSNNKQVTEKDLSNSVFSSDSKIIRNIISNFNIDYDIYRVELIEKKDYLETLTIEERKDYLERSSTPDLIVSSTSDIIVYGSDLGTHTSYINNEYPALYEAAQKNSDTENIQNMVSRVYTKKEIVPKKQSWFGRLFTTDVTIPEEFEFNGHALAELKSKIDDQIVPLYDDIKMFESLAEYMEVYRKKNLEYLDKVNEAIELFNMQYKEIDENDLIQKLKIDTYIKALQAKRDSFVLTEHLIKNYIYSIYVLIQGDLITITGLEMSRDTLIPLIGAGKLISSGVDNQKTGINANKFIMSLLGNVVSKNNEGMRENLEELKLLGISDEKLLQISSDVNKYIEQITSARTSNLPVLESLPLQLPEINNNDKEKQYKK